MWGIKIVLRSETAGLGYRTMRNEDAKKDISSLFNGQSSAI
jgi:hypothetical protein